MKVTVEELSPSKRVLHVELPPERVSERVEATFREWGQKLQLPGFRRGRVPREIIRRRFESEVHEEVLRALIPDSYREALTQAAIEPVSQPEVEEVHFHAGEPLTYRAVVEIKPPVTATDYRGIALEREKVEVTDQEVDRALEYLREDAAEYVPMEGWPALKDDLVILDHEGSLQGKPFKGGSGKNLTVALGHEGYLPGFTEQLAGMQKGESKHFSLQMPAEYPRKELAGRSVEFRVTVKEVKKRRVPELNDDFARSVGDVETLGALRDKLRQQLVQRKTREQDAALKRTLMGKLIQQHTLDVPEAMVVRETAAVLEELAMTLRATGGRMEGLPEDPEALKVMARETATRRVKESLLLEAVARQEQLTVTEEEIAAEVNTLAGVYRQEPAAVRRALDDPARRAGLTERLAERKAMDFLFQHATITDAYHLITPA
ncbi:MAG: trigger factor [candidate division NC10 bacterium RBG_16_65_8]|nr:MAG: trigger factor [candidate division NC10 bacterium RBG_16_65_8]